METINIVDLARRDEKTDALMDFEDKSAGIDSDRCEAIVYAER